MMHSMVNNMIRIINIINGDDNLAITNKKIRMRQWLWSVGSHAIRKE